MPLSRSGLFVLAAVALAGCREAPEPPPPSGTENGAALTGVELPASVGETDTGAVDDGSPGFAGSTPASSAMDLRDGSVCYVYANHVVRVAPRGEAGDGETGQEVSVLARGEDGAPLALCESDEARTVTTDSQTDLFVGVEGDLLLLVRDPERDQKIRILDLADDDAVVLDAVFDEPVSVEEGVLQFGSLEGLAGSDDDLEGVTCDQAEAFTEAGFEIGIVQVRRFSFETRETEETEERLCVPIEA